MVRSKESTGDVGIVFDDDDDDISGVNVSRTKGVSSPSSSFVSLIIIITFDDTIFFVGIGLDLFFVAEETTVAIKIAFASKHFNGVGVIDTLLDKKRVGGKTIFSSLFNAFRTNPNGFFGATSSKSINGFGTTSRGGGGRPAVIIKDEPIASGVVQRRIVTRRPRSDA